MTNEEYLSSIDDEHLRNIQEQLLLDRLVAADNDDDRELIIQALRVINGKNPQFTVPASIPQYSYQPSAYNIKPTEVEIVNKEKEEMTTNERIEDEMSDAHGLIDVIAALLKWLNSQFMNAIMGVLNCVWKLIYNTPKLIYNAFTKGIPWVIKRIGQFGKFVFSDKFLHLSWDIICLVPLFAIMIAIIGWPFGVWYFIYPTAWWLVGSIVWTLFFGVYGAVQGWKHDFYGKARNAVSSKVKKYNSDYFKSSNVLKRAITGEK